MTWTDPVDFSAGATLTAAQLNATQNNLREVGSAMESYTPALSNWSLGNGTLTGKYMEAGKFVRFELTFVVGSTTSKSGTLIISLPVDAAAATSVRYPVGLATLFDASGGNGQRFAVLNTVADQMAFTDEAGAVVTHAVPWTWATGDRVIVTGHYEAA